MSINIRTAAEVKANIDRINAEAEATGQPVNGGELHVLTLEAKAASAIERFEKATREYESQARVAAIEVGDILSVVFGRAHNKKVLSGNVISIDDEKSGRQFTLLTGSGKDSKVVTVGADSVLLDAADVAAAEEEIAAAVAAFEAGKGADKIGPDETASE